MAITIMELRALLRASHHPLALPFCLALVLAVLWPLTQRWRRSRQIRNFKKLHNCAEPNAYPHQDAWGTDLARIRAKAVKEGHLFDLYRSQFDIYGKTFSELWRGTKLFNTTEPLNVQHVAGRAAQDFGKDSDRETAQWPLLGPSIFGNGPVWSLARDVAKPFFARAQVANLDDFSVMVDKFMALMPEKGVAFDIQPLVHRLFLDQSMEFIFGSSFDSLRPEGSPESNDFTDAFTAGLRGVSARRDAPWFQFHYQRIFEDPAWTRAYRKVHRFVDQQVQQALQSQPAGGDHSPSSPSSEKDPKRYVLLNEMAKHIRDPIALRYHLLGFFMPARDATSRMVANSLFQLARHPHEWTKLRRDALALGDTPLTYDTLRGLSTFRNVMYETVRTVGPAARIWRVAMRDAMLPRGGGPDQSQPVFVPKGSPVVLGTWCMNHDADIWGADVDVFRPDRFVDRKLAWDFLPFYGGPRICPAQQQAMTQAVYVLVRLTQRFDSIENHDPTWEFLQLIKMGVESMNGVQIAFR